MVHAFNHTQTHTRTVTHTAGHHIQYMTQYGWHHKLELQNVTYIMDGYFPQELLMGWHNLGRHKHKQCAKTTQFTEVSAPRL